MCLAPMPAEKKQHGAHMLKLNKPLFFYNNRGYSREGGKILGR